MFDVGEQHYPPTSNASQESDSGEDHSDPPMGSHADDKSSSNWVCGLSYAQLRDTQLGDPDISVVLNWLEQLCTPVDSELRLVSPAPRSLWMCIPYSRIQR